jgi:hypothetical protein
MTVVINGTSGISSISTTYTGGGSGAVARTVASKLGEFVSVMDFGAVGDGVTDDTAAIQAAIASGNGTITGLNIHFPAGIYKITSTIDIGDKQNMYLYGDGSNTTLIKPSSGVTVAVKFGNTGTAYQGIKNMHIDCSSATSCTALIAQNINSFWLDGVTISNANIGILVNGGVIQYYTNFQINISKTCGIKIVGGNDQFFKHGVLSSVGSTEPSVAGIWCTKSDAFWLDSVDCISQKVGLLLAPQGTDYISWIFVSNCAFDSATGDGIRFDPAAGALVKGSAFTGCWTSTNEFGVNVTGLGTVDGCRFVNHRSYNNGKDGYLITNTGTPKNIAFDSCDASGNSQTTPDMWSGFDISGGVDAFQITNSRSGQQAGFANTQSRGILINPGASDDYIVTNNDVRLNVSAGIYDGGTGGNKVVRGNLGALTDSKGVATIALGLSEVTVVHGLGFTPVAVIATPTNTNLSGRDMWTGTYTDTTFQINVSTSVIADTNFSWHAFTANY